MASDRCIFCGGAFAEGDGSFAPLCAPCFRHFAEPREDCECPACLRIAAAMERYREELKRRDAGDVRHGSGADPAGGFP